MDAQRHGMLALFGWNRWITLVASGFAMLCAGPIFTFGAIHSDMRTLLGASEFEVQLIGVAGDIGLWTKVFPGMVFDKFGARATIAAGSLITGVGYLLTYVALVGQWSPILVAVSWFLAGQGSAFVYTGALFSSTKNFAPHERGFVTGILACLFGTSATVFSSLLGGCLGGHMSPAGKCSNGFLGGSVHKYMLLLAISVPIITFLAALATRVDEHSTPSGGDRSNRRFGAMFLGILGLIVLVFGKNLIELTVEASIKTWANYVVLAALALLLAVPAGTRSTLATGGRQAAMEASSSSISDAEPKPVAAPQQQQDALCQRFFWIFFVIFGITVGADLMTLNILSSIAKSRGLDRNVGRFLVIVQMGCDTVARLSAGFLAGKGTPLSVLLLSAPLMTAVAQAMLALGGTPSLYAACGLNGLSDGIMWTVGPLMIGRAFGLARVGRNFGIAVLSAALFQVLLSLGLEPEVYRRHVESGEEVCYGTACFAVTHWISGALAALAAALALQVHCARDMPAAVAATEGKGKCESEAGEGAAGGEARGQEEEEIEGPAKAEA